MPATLLANSPLRQRETCNRSYLKVPLNLIKKSFQRAKCPDIQHQTIDEKNSDFPRKELAAKLTWQVRINSAKFPMTSKLCKLKIEGGLVW